MNRIARNFFDRDTARVARDLLGKELVRNHEDGLLKGKVVETEAYYGESDPPSHASSGRTGRSKIMWEMPGIAYVYLIYGIHLMFNVVTEGTGSPGAVLIRALEPLEGLEVLKKNRGGVDGPHLTDGPGKLTEAFRIGKNLNGEDLVNSNVLWFAESECPGGEEIDSSGRIGISRGKEKKLRYFFTNNRYVSR